jgi:hypothetical protein
MLQVEIVCNDRKYAKYIFDTRFICRKITYEDNNMKFHSVWGEEGFYRTIPLDGMHYTIYISEVD